MSSLQSALNQISAKLAPHYQHFSNFIRVLTSFVIVLEFLIGLRKISCLLMHKICDFWNLKLTSRISTLSEKIFFSRVLVRLSIVLEFLTLFRNSSAKLRKIWLHKISTIFFQNLIFKSSKSSIQSFGLYSNSSTNKTKYTLF